MSSRRSYPSVDAVAEAMLKLSPLDRSILKMHLEGYKLTSIAEKVGLSRSTVFRRLGQAKAKLEDVLSPSNPRVHRAYEYLAQAIRGNDKN